MRWNQRILLAGVVLLFGSYFAGTAMFNRLSDTAVVEAAAFENPVSPLPDDNLIDFDSAWMRGIEYAPQNPAGFGRWMDETGHAALSCGASKNPSPDEQCGTMFQWDSSVQTAAPLFAGEQAWVSLTVDAPPVHDGLKFQRWHVGRGGASMEVIVFGFDSELQDWVEIWRPINEFDPIPRFMPEQSLLLETAVSQPYEKYLIRMGCSYSSGTAGCKTTGHYFAVTNGVEATPLPPTETSTAQPVPTQTPMVTATPTSLNIPIILNAAEQLEVTCSQENTTPFSVSNGGILWVTCEE